jgi:glucose/arabinose dehydrogenase
MEIIAVDADGISTRDIRQVLSRIIDIDEDGNETAVYGAVGNLHLSRVVAIAVDDDGDLVLVTEIAQVIMEDLDTWDEFTS